MSLEPKMATLLALYQTFFYRNFHIGQTWNIPKRGGTEILFAALRALVREIIPNIIHNQPPTYLHDRDRIFIDCSTPFSLRLNYNIFIFILQMPTHTKKTEINYIVVRNPAACPLCADVHSPSRLQHCQAWHLTRTFSKADEVPYTQFVRPVAQSVERRAPGILLPVIQRAQVRDASALDI